MLGCFQATRQVNEPIKEKAIKYLELGYQRELSFKHEDGSFSAFGTSDASGSTWLTAFVVRSFIAAKKHIFIDEGLDALISVNFLIRSVISMKLTFCFHIRCH